MKITVISRDERHLADMMRLLRARSPSDELEQIAGGMARAAALTEEHLPDVLIVDRPQAADDDLELLERFSAQHPNIACVIMSPEQDPQFLLQAMRAGVREVLPSPVASSALYPAMERIAEKLERRGQTNGKVLSFISCKGGSGATFLATNLGYALAASGKQRVALIDMNLQFGDASLFVSDHKPLATLSDVAQQIHRLDPSFLTSSMLSITPNYGVLAAPSDPAHANDVKPDHVDAILRLARRQYDFVVLDVGRSLDAVSIRALDHSDLIFPILQTTLPYIRDSKRLLNVFRSLEYGKDKIQLIVNRHDRNSEIRLKDLESAFDAEIAFTIPNNYDAAAASVNQGVPVLQLSPNAPISQSLVELARKLTGETAPVQQSGWLSKLMARK
ncbi:AAA family ATPase [Duganella callida]|uniref:CobQ/CobB/MinD/ParA nucleotide binding domain-containing protein n=1 Tax=Duganella callida TaxID=2561932 RepID=A0A4Y9SMP1_9BURK|nr:AAA family ATPase [Duganella callida]TFW27711.1 CobQ/CobB/MinD/ParA nucleotide binding domain-containing protein [Duganella callida]